MNGTEPGVDGTGGSQPTHETRIWTLEVPLYDATVHIIVTDDMQGERALWDHLFGECLRDVSHLPGFRTGTGRSVFGVFFHCSKTRMQVVSHEVFHLTHRILEWAGVGFDSQHHEAAAILHGYLMPRVWREYKRMTTEIKEAKDDGK